MLSLFRVFPWLPSAPPAESGGPLYVPPQGSGRLDNPAEYAVLYFSDNPSGAVAEAFGRFPEWSAAILEGSPSLPGSFRALAEFQLASDAGICDLDDPNRLLELGLRPSEVVSRDYAVTRLWARRLYDSGKWKGVRWWSYYNPAWHSYGLWDYAGLARKEVTPLSLQHPAFRKAAQSIARPVIAR